MTTVRNKVRETDLHPFEGRLFFVLAEGPEEPVVRLDNTLLHPNISLPGVDTTSHGVVHVGHVCAHRSKRWQIRLDGNAEAVAGIQM